MTTFQPTPGDVVDRKYRIQRLIGRGGMGAVYLAEHLALGRAVALKVMGEALRADEQYVRRFEREAKATYGLQHRNIVRVYDYGRNPAPYLVMEWIEGETLKENLNQREEPPPLSWVGDVMSQLFDALGAAHSSGVVHRDLKPENILLKSEGSPPGDPIVKVVDFGMARVAQIAENEPTLTQLDFVAGTPAYMSPEQCRSLVVGPASDLYSAGCILTELLQLGPPFAHGSAVEIMSQQMFAPPPALMRPPSAPPVPAALERLRRSLLAKHLHQRPSSAAAALRTLLAAFDASPGQQRGSLEESTARGLYRSEPPEPAEVSVHVFCSAEGGAALSESERLAWSAMGIEVRPWEEHSDPYSAAPSLLFVLCREPSSVTLPRVTELIRQASARGTMPVVVTQHPTAVTLPAWIEAGVVHVVDRAEPSALSALLRRVSRASSVPPEARTHANGAGAPIRRPGTSD